MKQANYMRIVGTKDEEFIFIVQSALAQFKLNTNKKNNKKWQNIWVEQIKDTCVNYLNEK